MSNQSFIYPGGPAGAMKLGNGGDLGAEHMNDEIVDKR